MTNLDVINFLNQVRKILLDDKSWLESTIQPINEAFDAAISALQEQEAKNLNESSLTQKGLDIISRQAAIDAIVNCTNCGDEKTLRTYVQKHNLDNEWTGGILEALNAIEDLPSVQPEIVRCKDCKWWSNDDYRECSSPNYDDGYVTPAGFYCGYAERKDDE